MQANPIYCSYLPEPVFLPTMSLILKWLRWYILGLGLIAFCTLICIDILDRLHLATALTRLIRITAIFPQLPICCRILPFLVVIRRWVHVPLSHSVRNYPLSNESAIVHRLTSVRGLQKCDLDITFDLCTQKYFHLQVEIKSYRYWSMGLYLCLYPARRLAFHTRPLLFPAFLCCACASPYSCPSAHSPLKHPVNHGKMLLPRQCSKAAENKGRRGDSRLSIRTGPETGKRWISR